MYSTNTSCIAYFSCDVGVPFQDTGIVIYPDSCTLPTSVILNNEVHSAMVGVFILPVTWMDCVQVPY